MKRSSFLASLAALAVAPFVKADVPAKEIPPPMPKFDRLALFNKHIDKYIAGTDPIDGGAGQILRIYNETGVLVWRPFKVIEGNGKV